MNAGDLVRDRFPQAGATEWLGVVIETPTRGTMVKVYTQNGSEWIAKNYLELVIEKP